MILSISNCILIVSYNVRPKSVYFMMASKCMRKCYKYAKYLAAAGLFIFFVQLYVAVKLFPADNDSPTDRRARVARVSAKASHVDQGGVSARKYNAAIEDDEDFAYDKPKPKDSAALRLEELDFEPSCSRLNKEAVSAVHRAKTQQCKRQIIDTACKIIKGDFYAQELPSSCPHGEAEWGRPLGCYQDEKKSRLLASFYGNYGATNTHQLCLDICLQAGFPYAGVQYSTECFCGEKVPPETSRLEDTACAMPCSGDSTQMCGGYFTMNVFETGVAKFIPHIPYTPGEGSERTVRIVFLLTLNGRALRQVHRLINALYRSSHYFYIHVDVRQHYLHRELVKLEEQFSNIKLASQRFSSIWGGASLLEMLLASMKDIINLGWQWDFVINLSESDYPIKSLERLEEFLTANKGYNFVKSHGREVQRFIKKQGLDKTFLECDTHMWRIGERRLPRGIIIDGGSDWIALSPEFVSYVVGEPDELIRGLSTIFKHTLLPAESFFHTALRNSKFCNTYVDNNLHVTNWKRKLGCKCQYKHVVDWCGCSPNDFRTEDWSRIQSTQDRQLFFARKFEPVINQEIIARVEQFIGYTDLYEVENLESYWQNIFHSEDSQISSDDTLLTHARSILRLNMHILQDELCYVTPQNVLEVNSYHYDETYKGNLILYKATIKDLTVIMETWYKPLYQLEINKHSDYAESIKTFKVSSEYDQKEQTFRNLGSILGPLSEPSLMYQLSMTSTSQNFTLVWLDPAGVIAEVNMFQVDENNFTSFVKPSLKIPLLPGVWKVALYDRDTFICKTQFLISPLELLSGKELSQQEVKIVHKGSQPSYQNYSSLLKKYTPFAPNITESTRLLNIVTANVHRIGEDLSEWVDSLSHKFYKVLGSCIHIANVDSKKPSNCGKYTFDVCKSTKWSSLAPDPKGSIGRLNVKTGRLDRV